MNKSVYQKWYNLDIRRFRHCGGFDGISVPLLEHFSDLSERKASAAELKLLLMSGRARNCFVKIPPNSPSLDWSSFKDADWSGLVSDGKIDEYNLRFPESPNPRCAPANYPAPEPVHS
jgi:hypothetical protein